jgi:hypothetical protein
MCKTVPHGVQFHQYTTLVVLHLMEKNYYDNLLVKTSINNARQSPKDGIITRLSYGSTILSLVLLTTTSVLKQESVNHGGGASTHRTTKWHGLETIHTVCVLWYVSIST